MTCILEAIGEPALASLKKEKSQWFISTEVPTDLIIKAEYKIKKPVITDAVGKEYIEKYYRKTKIVMFHLPELAFQTIKMEIN